MPLAQSAQLAVILAGGRSMRMGQDKATVLLAGRKLVDRVASRLEQQNLSVRLNASQQFGTELPLLPDTLEGYRGPLAGILASMREGQRLAHPSTHVLTVPVDSPFIPLDLAFRLQAQITGEDCIAIATSSGAMHPVAGLWPITLAGSLQTFLEGPENPRVKTFLASHETRYVEFPMVDTPIGALDPFFNVNTPEDLDLAHRYMEFVG